MTFKDFLMKHLPDATYSDGTKSQCVFYNFFSAIDPLKALDSKIKPKD